MKALNLWIEKNEDNVDQLVDAGNEIEESKCFDKGEEHRGFLPTAATTWPEILLKPVHHHHHHHRRRRHHHHYHQAQAG